MLITTRTAMHHRNPHPFQAKRAIALCPSWDLQDSGLTINRGHLNLVSESCLCKAYRQVIENIIALALKVRMRLHCQNNVQVTWCPATCTHLTFASYTYIDTIVDASRNIHHHTTIVAHPSLTTALLTGSGDHITLTTTAFTHRDIDKLTKDRLLNTPDLSGSLTGR